MRSRSRFLNRTPRVRRPRQGMALFVALLFIFAFGALALTATFLTANANLTRKSFDKEAELRYVAEAGLAMGKSRVNLLGSTIPDTGYRTLLTKSSVKGADGKAIPGVTLNLWYGPSGSTTGQYGRFVSVVAEARDVFGNGFIRRLELTQESFAKFAYWSDKESNSGSTIQFANGDEIWGPLFTNDQITIASSGAKFHDQVETAKSSITGASYGTFYKGYKTNAKAITLPPTTTLSKLAGFASAGGFNFTAPQSGDETKTAMRIEFVAANINGVGDSTGVNEGFFRVYKLSSTTAAAIAWLRGDYQSTTATANTCGDWHKVPGSTDLKFFPISVHSSSWFRPLVQAGGMINLLAKAESAATLNTLMQKPNARCYLGGDPHLVAVARTAALYPNAADRQKGGDDTTFTATDAYGSWQLYSATPNDSVKAHRPADAKYLFPIYRGLNVGSQGVIYVSGTTGLSGVLRGQVTLYATGTVTLLDDMRYASDPAAGTCNDMLGIIAGTDVVVADNALNTPQNVGAAGFGYGSGSSSTYRNFDDSKDFYIHAVMMALNTSFRVQNYNTGTNNTNGCETKTSGRGCLYMTGGVIQVARGAVGLTSGEGFIKRYIYDRCAANGPPPYFPTTGRYVDNRYYELDPANFSVAALFKAISSGK